MERHNREVEAQLKTGNGIVSSVVCRVPVIGSILKPLLEKHNSPSSIFKKLLDAEYFKTVKLDSYGTLSWDNEVDFCPDVLYEMSALV